MELQLQGSFGYVLIVAVASAFVHHMWMAGQVMNARKQ
jgi:hypothetical protein